MDDAFNNTKPNAILINNNNNQRDKVVVRYKNLYLYDEVINKDRIGPSVNDGHASWRHPC